MPVLFGIPICTNMIAIAHWKPHNADLYHPGSHYTRPKVVHISPFEALTLKNILGGMKVPQGNPKMVILKAVN